MPAAAAPPRTLGAVSRSPASPAASALHGGRSYPPLPALLSAALPERLPGRSPRPRFSASPLLRAPRLRAPAIPSDPPSRSASPASSPVSRSHSAQDSPAASLSGSSATPPRSRSLLPVPPPIGRASCLPPPLLLPPPRSA